MLLLFFKAKYSLPKEKHSVSFNNFITQEYCQDLDKA